VLVVGLIGGVFLVAALLIRTPWHGPIEVMLLRLFCQFERLPVVGRRLAGKVEKAAEAGRVYAHAPGLLTRALAISMVANGLSIVGVYLYALAVGADIHLAEAAVVMPVVLAVGILPISINGIGTIEFTFIYLLGLMNVDPHLALAVAILRRLVLLGQSLVGGVLYSMRRFG
jgi:uncharacterized protein (TIRG00374 family)